MDQLKVLAVASGADIARLEEILECESINRMASLEPRAEEVDRAVSLPVDAVVMLTDRLTAEESAFLEKLYMSRSKLAFILLCRRADTVLMARAMENGVTKLMTTDRPYAEIREGIAEETERIRSRSESAAVRQFDSRVLSIFSPKGGCGKTTVAVNLAIALQQAGKQVALLDLDLQFGDVGVFLNLPRCDTFSDLAGEPSLTPAVVKSYLFAHRSGVKVLCAPSSPELAELVKPETVERVITVLRAEFDYLILDQAPKLDDIALVSLEHSDCIYLITNPEIPTLKNSRVCMGILKTLGLGDKIRLIINKAGDRLVSQKDVERSLDIKASLAIPWDSKTASEAINRGIPAVECSRRSKMTKAFVKYVRKNEV